MLMQVFRLTCYADESASRKLRLLSFPMTGFHRRSFGHSHAHGGGYRPGITPGSLFTDRTRSGMADTPMVLTYIY